MKDYPFKEEVVSQTRVVRVFSHDVDDEELTWHRDAEDRTINVIEGSGWYLQLDDELPVELKPGSLHFVPTPTWHRVVKRRGCTNLVVEVSTPQGFKRAGESEHSRPDPLNDYRGHGDLSLF